MDPKAAVDFEKKSQSRQTIAQGGRINYNSRGAQARCEVSWWGATSAAAAAFRVTGMSITWKPMRATPQAVAEEGEESWRPVHETQPYLVVAQKR